jgi:hypothetical protein
MKAYLQITNYVSKASIKEGDFVVTSDDDDVIAGRVEHVMTEGMFGIEDSEYSIEASQEDPAILIRKFEQEEESGLWEETPWLIGKPAKMCTPIQMLPLEEESMSKGYWTGMFDPKGLIKNV